MTTIIVRRPRSQRPLTQPMLETSQAVPAFEGCTNKVREKFHFTHPEGLYEYWYQRAERDGLKRRGEVRVRINRELFDRFISKNPIARMLLTDAVVDARNHITFERALNVTYGDAGWVLVTGVPMDAWHEATGAFHDPVGAFLRSMNLFFMPDNVSDPARAVVPQESKPVEPARVVKAADGKLRIARPLASPDRLQALAARFTNK